MRLRGLFSLSMASRDYRGDIISRMQERFDMISLVKSLQTNTLINKTFNEPWLSRFEQLDNLVLHEVI